MTTKHPLWATYEMILGCTRDELDVLALFFRRTLGVACIDWVNVSHEMAHRRAHGFQPSGFGEKSHAEDESQTLQLVRVLQGLNDMNIESGRGCEA
jgi:hypothetical protein